MRHVEPSTYVLPLAYSIPNAGKALGVGRSSIYCLINEGRLKSIQVRGRRLIPRDEVERLAREGTRPCAPKAA